MKRQFAVLGIAVLLCTAILAAVAAQAPASGHIKYVMLVSIDGMVPSTYLEPDAHGLKVPTLREIVRNGAYSTGARSVFPSVTYPSHTAMATGTNPGTHGILTNIAWDPLDKNQRGWRWYAEDIRVPTLWQVAMASGLRTALVSWPATVGAQASALVPEYWRAGTPDDVKLLRALSAPPGILHEVDQRFPDFRAGFTPPATKDEALTDIAVYLIQSMRPQLLMAHIFEVDHWQHEKGLFSSEARAAIETADAQVERLIRAAKEARIWDQTALVVVSDHGFAAVSKAVRPGVLLRSNGLITLEEKDQITGWKAAVLPASGSAYLYVKDPDDRATQENLREIFAPLAGKPDSGILRVLTHEQIVALGGDPNAFLALDAADGYWFIRGYSGDYISASPEAATHGYVPDRQAMQASLLVYGSMIGAGKIDGARLIDVGPTIANWLGLKLDKAEGKPLEISLRTN